jgi:ketosteroid isomerase-like protein
LRAIPQITFKNIIAEGNFVVIESEGKAATKTGKSYNQINCEVFRFKGNMLEEVTTYLDTKLG